MKFNFTQKTKVLFLSLIISGNLLAGNKDRAGQAGSTELLINPWARSSGLASSNTASSGGIESQFINVAGLAFTKKTEIIFARTNWLVGSGTNINAIGLSQRVSSSGVLGIGFMSMGFGDIQKTTVDNPEGGIGIFTPRLLNFNVSYAKEFSNSIYGGVNFKAINQSIANVSASGFAIDAGIQYVTGKRKEIKFGIALKNVGTPMTFKGDGLSLRAQVPIGTSLTVEQRSAKFELPSSLNIGGAYDIYFDKEKDDHRITATANYLSNSFTRDIYQVGAEYAFKKMFMVRLGNNFEQKLYSTTERTNALTGFCAGATVEVPLSAKGSTFGIDYSYRTTNPFGGSHSLGVRVNL